MIDDVASHPSATRIAWRVGKVASVVLGVLVLVAMALRLRKPKPA